MSTIYQDTTKSIAALLAGAGFSLPVVAQNDTGDGIDLTAGFLGLSVDFNLATRVTINHPRPKVRYFGWVYVNVCTPTDEGVLDGLEIADELHTLFSGKVLSSIHYSIGAIDSKRQIKYAKGNYWCTPFMCKFYIEEYLTVV